MFWMIVKEFCWQTVGGERMEVWIFIFFRLVMGQENLSELGILFLGDKGIESIEVFYSLKFSEVQSMCRVKYEFILLVSDRQGRGVRWGFFSLIMLMNLGFRLSLLLALYRYRGWDCRERERKICVREVLGSRSEL